MQLVGFNKYYYYYPFEYYPKRTSGSSKWSLSIRFHHQNSVNVFLFPIHATWPENFIVLDLCIVIFSDVYHSWSCSLCNFLWPPVTSLHPPPRSKYIPQCSIFDCLHSVTFFCARGQVVHHKREKTGLVVYFYRIHVTCKQICYYWLHR